MAPQLQVYKGGWVAAAEGLAVFAPTGQEALLRFEIARCRAARDEGPALPAVHQAAKDVKETLGGHLAFV